MAQEQCYFLIKEEGIWGQSANSVCHITLFLLKAENESNPGKGLLFSKSNFEKKRFWDVNKLFTQGGSSLVDKLLCSEEK